MSALDEETALEQARERLAELLEISLEDISIDRAIDNTPQLVAGANVFPVILKSASSAESVLQAIYYAQTHELVAKKRVLPIIVVPYMGEIGARLCKEAGLSWLDLSGNAHIRAPGLYVRIEGHPNRFKRPGRPSELFAPKSSRITRWLLMHPDQAFTQRELAQATGLDEGFTSKIVRALEEGTFIVREEPETGRGHGPIRVRDPDLMLDAWREDYSFSKHTIIEGHIAARSSDLLLRDLAARFDKSQVDYAATGLGAAWLLSHFAMFRIVTFYLKEYPNESLLRELAFRQEPRGANVWLVVPNDIGVFHGASIQDDICCVHPIQVYLDLKGHPERAPEAADQLRSQLLKSG
jgi:hypothetical protein